MLLLDIIIVNWNSGKQLLDCLASITEAARTSFVLNQVTVVDNASTDESANGLPNLQLPLKIIHNEFNKGFAAACNQGARGSAADYLLFLNPDSILYKNSLMKPIELLTHSNNLEIGIVGIQLLDDSGKVSRTCCRFPQPNMFISKILGLDRLFPRVFHSHFMSEWDHSSSREVDHVIGAFYLVRRSVFHLLGGFDERFFVYLEDLDFSIRARQAGYKSFYMTDTQAYHKGGGTSEQVKATRLFYSLRSRIFYSYKHFGWITALCLMFATLFIEPFTRIIYAVGKQSGREMVETIRAYMMLWRDSPNWIRRISIKT